MTTSKYVQLNHRLMPKCLIMLILVLLMFAMFDNLISLASLVCLLLLHVNIIVALCWLLGPVAKKYIHYAYVKHRVGLMWDLPLSKVNRVTVNMGGDEETKIFGEATVWSAWDWELLRRRSGSVAEVGLGSHLQHSLTHTVSRTLLCLTFVSRTHPVPPGWKTWQKI